VIVEQTSEYVVLTEELIRAGGTKGIGFNWKQLVLLGALSKSQRYRELKQGWMKDLLGKKISKYTYNAFLTANKHNGVLLKPKENCFGIMQEIEKNCNAV